MERQPVVLFRVPTDPYGEYQKELWVANKHFVTTTSRMSMFGGDLVIGRYSVVPYYNELEADLKSTGATLINSYEQHCYVADLQNYVVDLEELTPYTWSRLEDVPDNCGPVILKGETNSCKGKWKTHMFASNKKEAIKVFQRLSDDNLVGTQRIYVRKYVPLELLMTGVAGEPIALEYRFFCCDGKILSSGFYWTNYIEDLGNTVSNDPPPEAVECVNLALSRIGDNIKFVVVDVARTQSGNWIVIELNDGQCSGLSGNDPEVLYKNLKDAMWHYKPTS